MLSVEGWRSSDVVVDPEADEPGDGEESTEGGLGLLKVFTPQKTTKNVAIPMAAFSNVAFIFGLTQ